MPLKKDTLIGKADVWNDPGIEYKRMDVMTQLDAATRVVQFHVDDMNMARMFIDMLGIDVAAVRAVRAELKGPSGRATGARAVPDALPVDAHHQGVQDVVGGL